MPRDFYDIVAAVLQPPHPAHVAMLAVMTVVISAPFERALFAVPGLFTVTTVEAAMALALCLGAAARSTLRPLNWRPRPLALPGAAFLAALLLAALVAPSEQGNSLRFVARMAMASLMFLLTVHTVTTLPRARLMVRAWVAVATIVAVIAVLEAAQISSVISALRVFRPGFHVVAGQLRATSTLFYPTIASMYLEIAFALGLWLLLDPSSTRPRTERALAFAALTLIGAGIAATFTRAGLVAMAAALVLVAGVRVARMSPAEARVGTIAALGGVLVAIVFLSHSPELLATRLSTEGSQAWYGARYQVPATLDLSTGGSHKVPITVANTGRLTWDSNREPAFAMSYHWLRSGSDAVIQFDGQRTAFPSPVPPGTSISLPVDVIAPGQAGTYTLVWDVVHETRAWLSTEGVPPARTEVRVAGSPTNTVATMMDRLPRSTMRPARPALWAAALRIASDRPLLGLGPDNFRHVYGRYIGIDRADPRVHANNMYLEVLAGAGLIGLLALLWLMTTAGLALWVRCRRAPLARLMPAAAALAAWLMVAGHGLVDSFLSFTTTYLTFALAAGLAFSPGLAGKPDGDAHRI
jgi:O-antigen ligase